MIERRIRPTNPYIEFPSKAIERSIPERFAEMVRLYGDRLAVKDRLRALTYSELNWAANHLAHLIVGERGDAARPVALLLGHGAAIPMGIMGALKAGRFFVPLDPEYPEARTRYMLEDSAASVLVTGDEHDGVARRLAGDEISVINLDRIDEATPTDDPRVEIGPDSLAYVLYTSGSTGHPKGVMHNHRNALHNALKNTQGLHLGPEDRISMLGSYTFTGTLGGILATLLTGAALCIFSLEREGLNRLRAWLAEEEITFLAAVVSVYRVLCSVLGEPERLPKLRIAQIVGEPMLKQDVEQFKRHFPRGSLLLNLYGCTELSRATEYYMDHETELEGSRAPVGWPCEGVEILLLDEDGQPVGLGEAGEIAIKSRYLALGYWRQPGLTEAAFQQDSMVGEERTYRTGDMGRRRADGCLVHLGRKDRQVQIRGMRVEIAEIESALLAHPTVEAVAVAAHEDRWGGAALTAFVVMKRSDVTAGQQPGWPTDLELRAYLAEILPPPMLPARFTRLDTLPMTPSGKVDRRALPG